jgi:hypothetical protein
VAAEVAAAVEAVKGAKPIGSELCLDTVRRLRQLLSNYDEPPLKEAVQAGAVPVLVAALQPPRMDATAMETVFEAAWAITNLATVRGEASRRPCLFRFLKSPCLVLHLKAVLDAFRRQPVQASCALIIVHCRSLIYVHCRTLPICVCQGEFETVKAVLAAAPILIAYLGGGSGLPVAEQCAWALGESRAGGGRSTFGYMNREQEGRTWGSLYLLRSCLCLHAALTPPPSCGAALRPPLAPPAQPQGLF